MDGIIQSVGVKSLYLRNNFNIKTMEGKIKEKLEAYGLLVEDLTAEELELLKKEIESESQGKVILDGVLSSISFYERATKRHNKYKEQESMG